MALTRIKTDQITDGEVKSADLDTDITLTGDLNVTDITMTGELNGPATFYIDPAPHDPDTDGATNGLVVIRGDLQVDGTTTTVNSTTMDVADLNITLASGAANAAAADGAGLTVDGASATITYDATNDEWDFNKPLNITGGLETSSTIVSGHDVYIADDRYLRWPAQATGSTGGFLFGDSAGTGGSLTFYRNSDSADILTLLADGKVGLGSSAPSERLHIHSAADTTIKITDETVGNETYGGYVKGFSVSGSGGRLQLGSIDNNVESLAIEIQEQANGIHFNTKDGANGVVARRLSILGTNGNVGIGTQGPDTLLHISATSPHIDIGPKGGNRGKIGYHDLDVIIGSTSSTGEIIFKNNIGSTDGPQTSGDTKMVIHDVGMTLYSDTYNILNIATDTNDDQTSTDGIVKITNGASHTTKAEFRWDESEDLVHVSYGDHGRHISINSSGNVGIGTGSVSPAHTLDVDGAIATRQVRHNIRPTLNLDFANSKAIPSDLFFYRNSTGTYYDKTGILRYAQHNVPRFDHDPDTGESLGLMIEEGRSNLYGQINGAYNPQNTSFVGHTMAPDGTMSASMHMITGNGYHRVQNNMNLTDGVSYRFSIYMKLVEGSDIVLTSTTFQAIDIGGGGGSASYVAFERAVPVGNGWYRIEFAETAIDATSLYVTYLYINEAGTNNYNANNNVVALWGGQLEEGGYSSSYIPRILKLDSRNSRATYYDKYGTLRTAPKHTPRYGYRFNGKRWIETGFIRETDGINLIDQSENFTTTVPSGSAWNTVRSSIIENATQAPDGTDNASQLTPAVFTSSDGYTRYYESFTDGQFYTFTIYAKAGDYTWFNIVALDNNGAAPIAKAWFDVSNGVVGTTTDSGGLIAARIENVDNGWYRCALMFEAQQTATGLVVITPQTSDGGSQHTSDGAGGLYIWGAMLEAQDSITSYIRTVGGNTTRIADSVSVVSNERPQEICRYEISNDWWNYNEGTFYAHAVNAGGNPRIFYASNFASTQRMGMYISGNDNARFLINDGSTSFDSTSAATYGSRGDELKIAGAFTAADVAVSDNGTTPITSTSSSITIPQNMTYVNIGAYYNSIPEGSIWIKKFAYYPEQLTDAEVQALSEND
jgi:hypothetical protein